MTMPPVIVIVAGANRDAEIFRLCGSRGANGGKTQNGGSDCNVFHAYPPNASCWETKRFRVHSVPRFHFCKARTKHKMFGCVNLRAVENPPLRRRRARSRAGSVP